MLSHRIDFAHALVGPMQRLVASLRNLVPTRGGRPSDVDDWVSMLCDFQRGATGVLESTKLATGRGEGHRGVDVCEVNGPGGTLAYSTQRPNELLIGRKGSPDLERIAVPREFVVWPGSPRDPDEGDPLTTFRYDQDFEFIDAIVNGRACRPSFKEGVMTQLVMDAAVRSNEERTWVDVDYAGAM